MDRVQEFCLIIFFCLLPFVLFLFKPGLIGIDSYAYLNVVCNNLSVPESTGFLASFLFEGLSCNVFLIKVSLFFLFLANTLIIALFGELFHKKGWITGLMVFLSSVWINWSILFEDDQLAYPFLFFGLFLFWKGELEFKDKFKLLGLFSVLFAGLIWKGSIYFLIGLFPLMPFVVLIALPFVLLNFTGFIQKITPDLSLTNVETIPFIVLPSIAFLLMGLKRISFHKKFLIQTIYFFVLACLNANFGIFVVPFLAVGLMLLYYESNQKQQMFFKVLLVAMVLGVSFTVLTQMPNQDTWSVLEEGHKLSLENNKPLFVDWTFRHYADFKGIEFIQIVDYHNEKGYVVHWKKLDCKVLIQKKNLGLYEC